MNGNLSELDEFRREVNLNLAVGALADVDLPVTGDDGGFPVVVALEDELLATVLGRLRAVGGFANLFVRGRAGVRQVSVIEESAAIPTTDDDMSQKGEEPSSLATVGMFLDWVERHPNGVTVSDAVGRPARARDSQSVELSAV